MKTATIIAIVVIVIIIAGAIFMMVDRDVPSVNSNTEETPQTQQEPAFEEDADVFSEIDMTSDSIE